MLSHCLTFITFPPGDSRHRNSGNAALEDDILTLDCGLILRLDDPLRRNWKVVIVMVIVCHICLVNS